MRKRILIGAIVALTVAAAVFAREGGSAPTIGKIVPDFTLQDTEGNTHRLSTKKDNSDGVFLFWISTQCPVSNAYNERFNALFNEFRGKDITFFAINSNTTESLDAIKRHAEQHGFKFVILRDPDSKVADLYKANVTPEAFLTGGDLVLKYHGAIDGSQNARGVTEANDYARNALTAVVAGRNPSPSETKAFGCSIKRPRS